MSSDETKHSIKKRKISKLNIKDADVQKVLKNLTPPGSAVNLKSRSLIYMRPCHKQCFSDDITKINEKLRILQESDVKHHINWDVLKTTLANIKCEHRGGNGDSKELKTKLDFISDRLTSIEKTQISGEMLDKIRDHIEDTKHRGTLRKEHTDTFIKELKDIENKIDDNIMERKKSEIKYDEILRSSDLRIIDQELNNKNVLVRLNDLKDMISDTNNEKDGNTERMTYMRDKEMSKELDRLKIEREETKTRNMEIDKDISAIRAKMLQLEQEKNAVEERLKTNTEDTDVKTDENKKKSLDEDLNKMMEDIRKLTEVRGLDTEEFKKVNMVIGDKDIMSSNNWFPPQIVSVLGSMQPCCKPLYQKLDRLKVMTKTLSSIPPLSSRLATNRDAINELSKKLDDLDKKVGSVGGGGGGGGGEADDEELIRPWWSAVAGNGFIPATREALGGGAPGVPGKAEEEEEEGGGTPTGGMVPPNPAPNNFDDKIKRAKNNIQIITKKITNYENTIKKDSESTKRKRRTRCH
jgi:hypothetical protein